MNWKKLWQMTGSDYFKLTLILGLAFYTAFIPHWDYPYLIHVDEWIDLTFAKATMHAGGLTFTEPFFGQAVVTPASNYDSGFHLFWGVFQQLSGISWLAIYKYFPSIIFVFTVLAVYILGKKEGWGLESAFFVCLIPTTVGILGPAFLVPVALGLLFTPLILFLAINYKIWQSYLLIFIFICFLLVIHAPSAICPIIIITPYILFNLKGSFRHSLGILLALILPFLGVFPWIFELLLPTAKGLFIAQEPTPGVSLPSVILTYGFLPILLCLIGTSQLVKRGTVRSYSLVLGLLAMLLMLVTFFTFHRGVPIMYERGLMYMMLMVGIIAGAGLGSVKNIGLPTRMSRWVGASLINQNAGRFIYILLIGLTLMTVIPERIGNYYYMMIDEEDYQAFVWIKDNVGEEYEKAVLDPWKATAFTAITGKSIYTKILNSPEAPDKMADEFLDDCSDTDFLMENGISIVYTRWVCDNPDLVQVREYVYLLEPDVK